MHPLTIVFLLALALNVALESWLATRHIRYVQARRPSVPKPFEDQIPLDAHHKAADYTVARTRFGRIMNFYGALLLLAWTLGGGLEAIDAGWRTFGWSAPATGTGFFLSVVLLMGVLELPADLYRTFAIEAQFGFNRTTPRLYVGDLLKKILLMALLGGLLIFAALWLMERMGTAWWLYVWALWVTFALFMVWAYPTLIAPLFNRFKPLAQEGIRRRIQSLLERTGFTSRGIFVVDSSRRTSHGNAYFTGFGRNKRIVFFDNLLETLAEEEVEAVVAHELGHFKLKHIVRRMVLMAIMSLAGLALLGWLLGEPGFYNALGMSRPSNHAALMLFMLAGPVFTFFLTPLLARSSRRYEFEADEFAARETGPDALVRALVKLYQENASTLTPDPLHSAFYDSHPPASVRIAHLLGHA